MPCLMADVAPLAVVIAGAVAGTAAFASRGAVIIVHTFEFRNRSQHAPCPLWLSAHNRLDLGKSQKQRRLREALAGLQLPFPRRLDDLRLGHGASDSNKGPVCPRFGPIPFVGPIQLLLQDYCSGQVA